MLVIVGRRSPDLRCYFQPRGYYPVGSMVLTPAGSAHSARLLHADTLGYAAISSGGKDGVREIRLGGHKHTEGIGQEGPQIFSMHDRIDHAVLQEKFRSLETVWKFLPDRLFNDTRASEAD